MMYRKDKIKLLQQISEGKIRAKALTNGRGYLVCHYLKPDVYAVHTAEAGSKPRILTPAEYEAFTSELEEHNRQMVPGKQIKNFIISWQDCEAVGPE